MANERTYPALPTGDMDASIAFYESLGFTRTYRQVRPNPYAVVALEDIGIHLFGIDGFVQFLKSLLKVALTGLLAWWVLNPHLKELENLAGMEPVAMLTFSADILKRLVFAVAAFLLVVAGADWFWQNPRRLPDRDRPVAARGT